MSLDRASGLTAGAGRMGGGTGIHTPRTAARLAWVVATLAVSSGLLFLVLLVLNGRHPEVVTYEYWGAQAVTAMVFPTVGALIVSRHPRNALGWLFCLIGLSSGSAGLALQYATYALVVSPDPLPWGGTAAWLDSWAGTLGFVSLVLVPLLFPDGKPPSRRWRPVVWIAAGAIVLGTLSFALAPGPLEGYPSVENPFGVEGVESVLELLLPAGALVLTVTLFVGIASLIVRYRRSRGAERQQVKWFPFAVAAVPLALLGNDLFPDLAWLIGGVSVACMPVAIGIAVLKHRLYDIDFVINRTLVYGSLTVCIVGLYVLLVGYLGAIFRTGGNLAISLVATGLVAVLFQPLRERLQRAVNRLVYGERDEPYAVLSRLGRRLEATLDPKAVLPAVVETVAQALKAPHAEVSLKREGGFETAAKHGTPSGDTLTLPLAYQNETVGRLIVSPRTRNEPFAPTDRRLLEDLARLAGVAAYAVRLTSDLQRSRERLVSAREEERLRLRRDLHDGIGPQLAALTLKLETARNRLARDPEVQALLSDLAGLARAAVDDVRSASRALRPPVLDELGLVPALREVAAQHGQNGLCVSVDAPRPLPSLPAAVEVAAYRIAQEALTNVVRHASAKSCTLSLVADEEAGELLLEVTDDGRGVGEGRGMGVGLHSMRERAEELGGTFSVGPGPSGGTRVSARLPLTRRPEA